MDKLELLYDKRYFDALVKMLSRTEPHTDDEHFIYDVLMDEGEGDEPPPPAGQDED